MGTALYNWMIGNDHKSCYSRGSGRLGKHRRCIPAYFRGGVILARTAAPSCPARPLEGDLAKVAVVAVPNSNAAVLSLQRTDSDTAGRGYRLATVALR